MTTEEIRANHRKLPDTVVGFGPNVGKLNQPEIFESLLKGMWEVALQVSLLNDQVRLLVERSTSELKTEAGR